MHVQPVPGHDLGVLTTLKTDQTRDLPAGPAVESARALIFRAVATAAADGAGDPFRRGRPVGIPVITPPEITQ